MEQTVAHNNLPEPNRQPSAKKPKSPSGYMLLLFALCVFVLAVSSLGTEVWRFLNAPFRYQVQPLDIDTDSHEQIALTSQYTITGSTEPSAHVSVKVDSRTVASGEADRNGHFEAMVSMDDIGYHWIQVASTYKRAWLPWIDVSAYSIYRKNDPPTQPVIFKMVNIPAENALEVFGLADPETIIEIEGAKILSGQAKVGKSGQFRLRIRAENNLVLLRARNMKRDTPWTASEPTQITNLGNFTTTIVSQDTIRELSTDTTVHIYVKQGQLASTTYSVSTRQDRPEVAKLLSGTLGLGNFYSLMVGEIKLNDGGGDISVGFQNETPFVQIRDTAQVTTTVHGTRQGTFNPFGPTVLEFSFPEGFPLPGNTGSFRVTVDDYTVASISPVPAVIEGNTFSWTDIDSSQTVRLGLNIDRLAVLRTLPRLNLSDIFGKLRAVLETFYWLSDLIRAFPLIWALWLLYHFRPQNILEKPAFGQIVSVMITSLTVLCAYRVSELDWVLSRTAASPFKQSPYFMGLPWTVINIFMYQGFQNHDLYSLATILCIVILSLVFGLIAGRAKRAFFEQLMYTLAKAGLIIFLLKLLGVFLAQILSQPGITDNMVYSLTTWIVGSMVVSALLFAAWSQIKRLLPSQKVASWWFLVLPGIMVFSIAACFPTRLNVSSLDELNFLIKYLNNLEQLFSTLGNWYFYFSFLAIVMIAMVIGGKALWVSQTYSATLGQTGPLVYPAKSIASLINAQIAYLREGATKHRVLLLLGYIVFAGYIVGTTDIWTVVPISFILGLGVYLLLLRSPDDMGRLSFFKNRFNEKRADILRDWFSEMSLHSLKRKQNDLMIGVATGKTTPSDYEKSKASLQAEIDRLSSTLTTPQGVSPEDFAFTLGPFEEPWANAKFAMRWGFWLQLPLMFIYMGFYLLQNIWTDHPYIWLAMIIQIMTFITRWLIMSFFFGFFYEQIRGEDGLKKALYLAGAVAISTLPYDLFKLTSLSQLPSVTFQLGQMALFIIALGILFDWEILRTHGYTFAHLRTVIADVPSLVTVGTIILSTSGVVVTSVLAGQTTKLLTAVLTAILPSLPMQ